MPTLIDSILPAGDLRLTLLGSELGGIDTYTKLMLHGDGTDASTNIVDSELTPKTVTVYGNAQIDTAYSKFGGASLYLLGDTDYVSVPDSADWDFGTGDFTIDLWHRPSVAHSPPGYIDQLLFSQGLGLYFDHNWNNSTGKARFVVSGSPGNYASADMDSPLALNTWHHLAVTRVGATLRFFVNGVKVGDDVTGSASAWGDHSGAAYIGTYAYTPGSFNAHGWFDEVRVSKGIARWTANFTPPTAPYAASGAPIGGQPILTATNAVRKQVLDQIGSFSFSMPATDPLAAYIQQGVHVQVNHSTLGNLGEYIVRGRNLTTNQELIDVECWALMRELTTFNCYLRRNYNEVAVTDILSSSNVSGSLYGLLYQTGWSTDDVDGGLGDVTISLNGQTIFQAIDALRERLNVHFRDGDTARTFDFGVLGVDCGYRLVSPDYLGAYSNAIAGMIVELAQAYDPEDVINKVIPLGGGQGDAQLTLQWNDIVDHYTPTPYTNPDGSLGWYLRDAASVLQYGERTRLLNFPNIVPQANTPNEIKSAARALYYAAQSWLLQHKDEHYVFSVKAVKVPAGLKVGDRVRVVYRGVVTHGVTNQPFKWIDVNELFYVMERKDEMDTPVALTSLTLSNLGRQPLTDTNVMVGALDAIKVVQTSTQPNVGRNSFVYAEDITTTHNVVTPVFLDANVQYLNECKLYVQTRANGGVYPTTIHIKVNGVDKTSDLGGPWATGGEQLTGTELDLTSIINAEATLRQCHSIEFSCDSSSGEMVVTVRLLETTQA